MKQGSSLSLSFAVDSLSFVCSELTGWNDVENTRILLSADLIFSHTDHVAIISWRGWRI